MGEGPSIETVGVKLDMLLDQLKTMERKLDIYNTRLSQLEVWKAQADARLYAMEKRASTSEASSLSLVKILVTGLSSALGTALAIIGLLISTGKL